MLEPAYHLFIRDEDDWCAQGRYKSIINRTPPAEDYIKWMKDENDKYFIHILGVCVSTLIFKIIRQLLIRVLLFISQGSLAVAPVLALDQFLVHLQIPLAFSKVLQIVWHSLIETCLLHCAIVWLKNWESMLLLQIAARLVYIFVGDAIWRSLKLSSKHRFPLPLVADSHLQRSSYC
jgi:hypothetical protein